MGIGLEIVETGLQISGFGLEMEKTGLEMLNIGLEIQPLRLEGPLISSYRSPPIKFQPL